MASAPEHLHPDLAAGGQPGPLHALAVERLGDVPVTVQGDQTITVKQGNQSLTISRGNQKIDVSAGKSEQSAAQSIELKVGANTIKIDTTSITLTVGGSTVKIDNTGVSLKGMMVKAEASVQAELKGMMTSISGDAMLQTKGGITMMQ